MLGNWARKGKDGLGLDWLGRRMRNGSDTGTAHLWSDFGWKEKVACIISLVEVNGEVDEMLEMGGEERRVLVLHGGCYLQSVQGLFGRAQSLS